MSGSLEKVRIYWPMIVAAAGVIGTWAVLQDDLREATERIRVMEEQLAAVNAHVYEGDADITEKVNGRVDGRLEAYTESYNGRLSRLYDALDRRIVQVEDRVIDNVAHIAGVAKDACENTNEISSIWSRIDDATYSKEPC